MPIDAWFPLAIYRTNLAESAQYKNTLLARIWQLRDARPHKLTDGQSSWTGDVHGIDMLHRDPAFDWLTQQVGHHAFKYLDALGHDLSLYDVYFQRSWPIIGGKQQAVAPHTHPTAHLSAVYYVSISPEGDPGKICFFNDANPNELFSGLDSHMTNGYKAENLFNAKRVNYEPADGWLFLFPSSLSHCVEANSATDYRISISYDLILTATEQGQAAKAPEFLMPSPTRWRKAIFNNRQGAAQRSMPATATQSSASQSSVPQSSVPQSLAEVPMMNALRSPQPYPVKLSSS